MKGYLYMLLGIVMLCLFSHCKKDAPAAATRSFYMGVTPWPAGFTQPSLDTAYQFINNHCDIVSHHFDEGIPYEEAYHQLPMPADLVQNLLTRKTKTAAGKKILLSVSALGLSRTARAGYYTNATVTDSLRQYWQTLPCNDPKMVTAYVNYVSWLADQLQPAYINYAVESNSLVWDPAQFLLYKDFLRQVYSILKTKYPAIPLFVSFMVDESTQGLANAQQLLPYTEYIALSSYPYITVRASVNGNTDPDLFPAGYYEKFINLDASKPLAFAETGYAAQDLVIPSFSLNKKCTADWQNKYLSKICQLSNDHKAELLIWFCSKDYDAGDAYLQSVGLYQDLFGLWQDTGLKDEAGKPRPAYNTWLQWMQKDRR